MAGILERLIKFLWLQIWIKVMKIKSNLFWNKKPNPFHDQIKISLVICYIITAIQM